MLHNSPCCQGKPRANAWATNNLRILSIVRDSFKKRDATKLMPYGENQTMAKASAA